MRAWGAWAEILQDPLLGAGFKDGVGPCASLPVRHSHPRLEMSNASRVGPRSRAESLRLAHPSGLRARVLLSIRRRCWCVVVQGIWEKGCPGTPVPDSTVPAKRVGNAMVDHSRDISDSAKRELTNLAAFGPRLGDTALGCVGWRFPCFGWRRPLR